MHVHVCVCLCEHTLFWKGKFPVPGSCSHPQEFPEWADCASWPSTAFFFFSFLFPSSPSLWKGNCSHMPTVRKRMQPLPAQNQLHMFERKTERQKDRQLHSSKNKKTGWGCALKRYKAVRYAICFKSFPSCFHLNLNTWSKPIPWLRLSLRTPGSFYPKCRRYTNKAIINK